MFQIIILFTLCMYLIKKPSITGLSIFVALAAGVIEGTQKLGKSLFLPSCMLLTLDVDGLSAKKRKKIYILNPYQTDLITITGH